MNKSIFTSLMAVIVSQITVKAEVTLPAYFSDNMIVQRTTQLPVIGKSSNPGSKVTVVPGWDKKEYSAMADSDGNFAVTINTPKAGGPYTLTIDDGDKLTLKNVLSGEVWICSGQSNMEMPVKGWGQVMDWEKELAAASHPSIRLLQVKRTTAPAPLTPAELSLNGDGWAECSAESVENFSAVAYFYARYLAEKLGMPIGVIDTSWGGTPAEAWTSIPTLTHVLDIDQFAAGVAECHGDMELLKAKHESDTRKWYELMCESDPGMDGDTPLWAKSYHGNWPEMTFPGLIEDQGLPAFDGSVWIQREVEIPESWAGKDLVLNLGGIDDDDITYYDGTEIGHCEGVIFRRTYTVPGSLVDPGTALITIRIQDNGGLGGINGEPADMSLSCGEESLPIAGSWKYHAAVPLSQLPARNEIPTSQNYPGNLYNAMIHPLIDFPVRGAIWYQGESNVSRWEQYTPLFQAMINNWRDDWGTEFPFYFVQLANYLPRQDVQPDSQWAHLREAQDNALQLENTGMAVAIDIGEEFDIHPKNKQEVGARLARAALAGTYGKGKYEQPVMKHMTVKDNKAILEMSRSLKVKGDCSKGFIICGADMEFHPAQATVNGNIITVSSPEVNHPVAVRYGWADNPECNIYTVDNLPLPPFRSDRFR